MLRAKSGSSVSTIASPVPTFHRMILLSEPTRTGLELQHVLSYPGKDAYEDDMLMPKVAACDAFRITNIQRPIFDSLWQMLL